MKDFASRLMMRLYGLLGSKSFARVVWILAWMVFFESSQEVQRPEDFLLCGVIGIICVLRGNGNPLPGKAKLFTEIFAAMFSLASILSNYQIFLPVRQLDSLVKMAFAALGSYEVCRAILVYAIQKLPIFLHQSDNAGKRTRPVRFFLICFAGTLAVFWLYLFFVAYPGYFTQDTKTAFYDIVNHSYGKRIPVFYTLFIELCLNIGYFFGGSGNSALVVYSILQSSAMAASFAYGMVTLYERGIPQWCLTAAWLIYTFLSYQIACSVMIWKDIPFSVAAFVMGVAIYRIFSGIGNRVANEGVFAVTSLIFCLSRTNGWYSFIAITILLIFILYKNSKRVLLIAGAVVLLSWGLLNPVLDQITSGRSDFLEVMSVPFQQVSRVIWSGNDVPEEDRQLLSQIADLEMVSERYEPNSVDPIKYDCFDRGKYDYFLDHIGEYASLWVRLGIRYPGDYLKAWIDVTKGYWSLGCEYWNLYAYGGEYEPLNFTRPTSVSPLESICEELFDSEEDSSVLRLFYSIGLQAWIVAGCTGICLLQGRKEYLIGIPAVVIVVGLYLCTPVAFIFRYAYAVALTMPFLLAVTVFQNAWETESG